jgi:ferrous iron transport protein A
MSQHERRCRGRNQIQSRKGCNKMTLNELSVGMPAVITKVGGEGILRCRFLDMGIIPNTEIIIKKIAPMGDPIEIRLRDYTLTIRREDAGKIEVEPLEE